MKMILERSKFCEKGIFGTLLTDDRNQIAKTLERAYFDWDKKVYYPKVPQGLYACERGVHTMKSGAQYETFEVKGVPGHSGILFHAGNFNSDSDGCILVGMTVENDMLTKSRTTFLDLMILLCGVEVFSLQIV